MSFTFRPATRDRIGLLFGVVGASGSGKTLSMLLLGQGIANGNGTMAVIDTEAGRAKHYANQFKFLHCDFEPPFEPKRYVEAVRASEGAGATVSMIDSVSHEWAGEGGCADMQAREAERMASDKNGQINYARLEAMTAPAWKRPKIEHKRMMARLVQTRSHLLFGLRAEEKVKFVKTKNDKGYDKTEIVPVGFQPICEKSFCFELSGFITLHPETPGVVRYDLPHKLNDDLQAIFPDGQLITRECGIRLREWAETGNDNRASEAELKINEGVRLLIEQIEDATAPEALAAILDNADVKRRREWLRGNRAHLSNGLEHAIEGANERTLTGGGSDIENDPELAGGVETV